MKDNDCNQKKTGCFVWLMSGSASFARSTTKKQANPFPGSSHRHEFSWSFL